MARPSTAPLSFAVFDSLLLIFSLPINLPNGSSAGAHRVGDVADYQISLSALLKCWGQSGQLLCENLLDPCVLHCAAPVCRGCTNSDAAVLHNLGSVTDDESPKAAGGCPSSLPRPPCCRRLRPLQCRNPQEQQGEHSRRLMG